MTKRLQPYGGYVAAKDRHGNPHAYAVLIIAESKEAAIEKETPIAKKRFPPDGYGDFKIELVTWDLK